MRNKVILAFLLLAAVPYVAAAKGKRISKIVIDAGHGGKDNGARGAISNEKDITLAVSLKLGKIFSDSAKDIHVIYTRTTDTYPGLVERHEIANQAKADLFVSVHVNSTPFVKTRTVIGHKTVKRHHKTIKQPIYKTTVHHTTKRSGVETYVLALRRNYQKEKSIGEYSENVTNETGLLDESDPQTQIIISQYAQAFLSKSVSLGRRIQEEFAGQGRPDLGVKQLPLEVLAGTVMPGVLVEIGFITNIEEEAYLNSERGQFEVALAIYKGIMAYSDTEK